MTDPSGLSDELLEHPIAKVPGALNRIILGKRRIQSVLDQHIVSHPRTLEQKISEQGPRNQHIDPHLLGHAIADLIAQNRLAKHHHASDPDTVWYANPATKGEALTAKLDRIAPLHHTVASGNFGNIIGDALEVIVYKALVEMQGIYPRYSFAGHFDLNSPKNANSRYAKTHPPLHLHGTHQTNKPPDFLQFGHDAGVLCIECKNIREWFYPTYGGIKTLIIRASELGAIPVLIARRLHYTMKTNFLAPAGIIAHEAYHQYYPADKADIAADVRDRNSLGFTDVLAVEEPRPRTRAFLFETLPKISQYMAARWRSNRTALLEYANNEINLAQLYNAIGSPAAGNWREQDDDF